MYSKFFLFSAATASAYIFINNSDFSERIKTAFSVCDYSFNSVIKWNSNWDLTNSNDNNSKKSKAIRNIILIRHGQYVYKDNDKDCKLTLLGREQADYTGRRLKELGIEFDKIVYSTMTRATETANIISKHIPSIKMECDSELIEGVPFVNEPILPHWNVPENIIKEDNLRIESAFRKYFHRAPPDQEKDSFEILVCHANIIRYMICRALQFPPEGWIRFSLDHASMTWIAIKPNGNIIVRSIGNSGFMPPDSISVE